MMNTDPRKGPVLSIFGPGGRIAPKDYKSPLREADGLTPVRNYQVLVEDTRTGERLRVGPAMRKDVIDEFAAVIRKQILDGKETVWANPTVVLV